MYIPSWVLLLVAAAAIAAILLVRWLKKWRTYFGSTLKQGIEATYADAGIEEKAIRLQSWATAILEKTGTSSAWRARHPPGFYERLCSQEAGVAFDRLKAHLERLPEQQRTKLITKMLVNYSKGTPAIAGMAEIERVGL
jgi:hypothetical protein